MATRGGFGLVPQGSPTNNTDSGASSAQLGRGSRRLAITSRSEAPRTRRDRGSARASRWPVAREGARCRRCDPAARPHAEGTDQAEARAMNIALWNGTLGYGLEQMLAPIVSRSDIASTRQFFTRYVSGRGPLPAVRVGNQPYGVLPAMAFSRYRRARVEGQLPAASAHAARCAWTPTGARCNPGSRTSARPATRTRSCSTSWGYTRVRSSITSAMRRVSTSSTTSLSSRAAGSSAGCSRRGCRRAARRY